jgi:hypothetical protein
LRAGRDERKRKRERTPALSAFMGQDNGCHV